MSLFEPEFGLIFWMLVVFLIVLFILARYGWPVIIKSLEERAEFINNGVKFSQEALKEKEEAKANAGQLIAEARKRQMDILQDAERMKQDMIVEARKTAGVEAQKVVDAARLSVEQMKKEAGLQIRRQVGSLSMQIAEKVLRKDLENQQAQAELIDKFLNEAEQNEQPVSGD